MTARKRSSQWRVSAAERAEFAKYVSKVLTAADVGVNGVARLQERLKRETKAAQDGAKRKTGRSVSPKVQVWKESHDYLVSELTRKGINLSADERFSPARKRGLQRALTNLGARVSVDTFVRRLQRSK